MSDPTNTLILTGFSEHEIQDKELLRQLQQQILENTGISETIKFSILKSFKRILIVFEKIQSAERLYKILKQCGFKVGFSSQNNYDDFILTEDGYKFDTREYLHLPAHGTTFIISPPPSPPPGWKSSEEEAPDQRAIYSPEELSELLYKRIDEDKIQKLFNDEGNYDSDYSSSDLESMKDPEYKQQQQKQRQQNITNSENNNNNTSSKVVDQKVLLESNKINSPIIVLEAPENEELDLSSHQRHKKPAKVALPPTTAWVATYSGRFS